MMVLRKRVLEVEDPRRGLVRIASWVGLVFFLEELSYGERIFKLKMPHVAGIKLDSLHDIVFIVYTKVKPSLTWIHWLVVGLVACTVAVAARKRVIGFVKALPEGGPWPLIVAFVALIGISQLSDVRIVMLEHRRFFEELLEFNAATALLGAVSAAAAAARADPP